MSVPLRVPFKTALRTVNSVEDIIVQVITDEGVVGYGEAPPTGAITGDTTNAILGALEDHIKKTMIGREIEDLEGTLNALNACVHGNTSAKAAVDMAIYDLFGQKYNVPCYKMFGGARKQLSTDITISVNDPEIMAEDTINAINRGYDTLKIKVGINPDLDVARLVAVRKAAGPDTVIRIDANQAWTPKQAVRILNGMQEKGINLELVEQPVKGYDLEGMQYVTRNSYVPVMADESVFSPMDAFKIIQMGAADMINIKLMKTGGIFNASKIVAAAEVYGMPCMMGCMLEAKVSVNAAVSFACGHSIIQKIDLDGPVLCTTDPVIGGATFNEKLITVSDGAGMGISNVEGVQWL